VFSFVGTGAFTYTAGELRNEQSGGNIFVYGDGTADMKIKVIGIVDFVDTDFVL
jgi:hypothetical protein